MFSQRNTVHFTLHRVSLYNFDISIHFTDTFSEYDMHLFIFFYQCLSCIYPQPLQKKKIDVVILCFFFPGYVWHLHDNANLFSALHFKYLQIYQASNASSVDPVPENFYFVVIAYCYFSLIFFFHILAFHILAFFFPKSWRLLYIQN